VRSIDVLPCKCGARAKFEVEGLERYRFFCTACKCSGAPGRSLMKALRNWNRWVGEIGRLRYLGITEADRRAIIELDRELGTG